jgi:hypothetical protein
MALTQTLQIKLLVRLVVQANTTIKQAKQAVMTVMRGVIQLLVSLLCVLVVLLDIILATLEVLLVSNVLPDNIVIDTHGWITILVAIFAVIVR